MKNLIFIASILLVGYGYAQEDPDTTRVKVGKTTEILIINNPVSLDSIEPTEMDTVDIGPKEPRRNNEAHWAGLDFGVNVNTNGNGSTEFGNYGYWENDPLQSFYFNINFAEKKIKVIKEYVGITTGLGFNFNQIGIPGNMILSDSADTIVGLISVTDFDKNKLRVAYFQVPLMLEFNTNKDNEKGVYLAVGAIAGVRIASRTKKVYEVNGDRVKVKEKGTYSLEPFKLDATARLGYGNWGGFVNYSMMPLFDTDKTTAVHPISFGLSYNF